MSIPFYTLDRAGTLTEGQVVNLTTHNNVNPVSVRDHLLEQFPAGVSQHGFGYFVQAKPANDVSNILELLFEQVRRAEFPNRPSRFTSLFACASLQEIDRFRSKYGKGKGILWEVSVESMDQVFRADMNHLSLGCTLLRLSLNFRAYWRGESGDLEPFWECLLTPPVTIVRRVT